MKLIKEAVLAPTKQHSFVFHGIVIRRFLFGLLTIKRNPIVATNPPPAKETA